MDCVYDGKRLSFRNLDFFDGKIHILKCCSLPVIAFGCCNSVMKLSGRTDMDGNPQLKRLL